MRFLKNNGLTIVLLLFFAASLVGQWLTGWQVQLADALLHGHQGLSLASYTWSAEFLSSVFENWESEFLQMSAFVVLTAFLVQRGSSESKDPDSPPRDANLEQQALNPDAPSVLSRGSIARAIYSRSLGIVLFVLFALSFVMHWTQSARAAAADARAHGEIPASVIAYLADPQLWFESFQNWQSEFLSTAVLIVLSIFLRQRESPESKPVAAPHAQTGN